MAIKNEKLLAVLNAQECEHSLVQKIVESLSFLCSLTFCDFYVPRCKGIQELSKTMIFLNL